MTSLAILAFTKGDPYALMHLLDFHHLSNFLDATFVVAGDGKAGLAAARVYADQVIPVETIGIQESHLAFAAKAIDADWILKLDDDESVTPAMADWLEKREWETGKGTVYSFPYAWLWGDAGHFITSAPFWPDPHARLMKRELFFDWGTGMHAPNPHGVGTVVPVAHAHHKFLVKSFDERVEVAQRYEALQEGSGLGLYYGKFTLPEVFCRTLTVRELGDGTVDLAQGLERDTRVEIPVPEVA